jgi:hypothetical protein
MFMSAAGTGTKNDCAGEGHQQFNWQTDPNSLTVVVARLLQSWDSKICTWVPREREPRMTVLARTNSNLTDRPTPFTVPGSYTTPRVERVKYVHECLGTCNQEWCWLRVCWNVFTEPLPSIALSKSITLCFIYIPCIYTVYTYMKLRIKLVY